MRPGPLPTEPNLHIGSEPTAAYASWRAPSPLHLPEVTPLRARPLTGPTAPGTRWPRSAGPDWCWWWPAGDDDELPAAAFHVTEVDRVAQLVRAAAVILGDRLDNAGVPPVVSVCDRPLIVRPAQAMCG